MTETKHQELTWLKTVSGELATLTIQRLEETLPWYGQMPPGRRSAVGLVAQNGISAFISWYDDPASTPWIASEVFGSAPRELLRSISLQQTLQLLRVVVTVVEERVTADHASLREAILLYSREVAFAAADVYARAAEARGLWDARLEALVVDSILTGESDDQLQSRIAALGWHGHGEASVLVGTSTRFVDADSIRRMARQLGCDVLIGVQGKRLVLVIGRLEEAELKPEHAANPPSFLTIASQLAPAFAQAPLVLGPPVSSLREASSSARAALAGVAAAAAWTQAPRPVLADDLLPERALAGDALARTRLIERILTPLTQQSPETLTTLWRYLENGRSLEATSRELIVHPNTVRYRLKRIADTIGWDPRTPRDAFVLQCALIVGAVANRTRNEPERNKP